MVWGVNKNPSVVEVYQMWTRRKTTPIKASANLERVERKKEPVEKGNNDSEDLFHMFYKYR